MSKLFDRITSPSSSKKNKDNKDTANEMTSIVSYPRTNFDQNRITGNIINHHHLL
jgi:hypothetical protein